jgi:hypothetical protein
MCLQLLRVLFHCGSLGRVGAGRDATVCALGIHTSRSQGYQKNQTELFMLASQTIDGTSSTFKPR